MSDETKPLVLITGASGFIAGHIINQALEDGYRIRGTVRSLAKPEKYQRLIDLGIELVAATLTSPDGWDQAVAGCRFVLHTASPFVTGATEEELVAPAVNGTRYVLEAAAKCPTVERVVVTSSMVSVCYGYAAGEKPDGYRFTPDDWSVVENCAPYPKSKTMAEKSAWKLKEETEECKFELVTVNPGFVMGPLLHAKSCESAETVENMMTGGYPMLPRIHMGVVDVRDVALVHVRALAAPEAPGKRLLCAPKSYWMGDCGQVLLNKFGPDGWPVTTRVAPDFAIKGFALFDSQMSSIVPDIGVERFLDCSETQRIIGHEWRDTDQAWIDMAQSLIDLGMMEKPQPRRCNIL